MGAVFLANERVIYRESSVAIDLTFYDGGSLVYPPCYDIEVCVYTTELCPRYYVVSYAGGYVPVAQQKVGVTGAYIERRREGCTLVLTDAFLGLLPIGALHLGIRHIGSSMDVVERVRGLRVESLTFM